MASHPVHDSTDPMTWLYRSLSERQRTEDVAHRIAELLDGRVDRAWLSELVGRAEPRFALRWSSMRGVFATAVPPTRQLDTAAGLFPDVAPTTSLDPDDVRRYAERLKASLGVTICSFRYGRQNRAARRALDLPSGHRAYNKRIRFLVRLERKLATWRRALAYTRLAQVARTRLASRVAFDDLAGDPMTAAFVAWMTARLGRRSVFTWGKQERPYDEVADMLYRALPADHAGWFAVAQVHPTPDVLARLDDRDRGRLLGVWFSVMQDAAELLEAVVGERDGYDLHTLIVRRGNDSSTFNGAAGAFNRARNGWIATVHSLGMDHVLDHFAPPKALRLMAADLVRAHAQLGSGDLHPDTRVWQLLPRPWDVIAGR